MAVRSSCSSSPYPTPAPPVDCLPFFFFLFFFFFFHIIPFYLILFHLIFVDVRTSRESNLHSHQWIMTRNNPKHNKTKEKRTMLLTDAKGEGACSAFCPFLSTTLHTSYCALSLSSSNGKAALLPEVCHAESRTQSSQPVNSIQHRSYVTGYCLQMCLVTMTQRNGWKDRGRNTKKTKEEEGGKEAKCLQQKTLYRLLDFLTNNNNNN